MVLVLLCAARTAAASGSVSLDLADDVCSLHIEQTFRKILDGDDVSDYVNEVRKDFSGHAAKILPAVSKAIRGSGALPFDVALPVVYCQEIACDEAEGVTFPAVLRLPAIRFGEDARRQYGVGVAFARRPTAAQLKALRAQIFAAIQPLKNAEMDPPALGPLGNAEASGKSYLFRVRPYLWTRPELRQRHELRVSGLVSSARTKLDALFAALPAGIQAVPCTPEMPYYEDNKRKLPGKLSRTQENGQDWRNVTYCLGKIAGPEALEALEEKLDQILDRP